MVKEYFFADVTLLIIHYNRSKSLERLLIAFRDLGCKFEDIVVSDDASKPEHVARLNELKQIFNYRLVLAPENKGFGNNMNKGRDAVNTPYTLCVLEDFVPLPGCAPHMLDALQIMNEHKDVDYIRFWSFYRYPVMKPYGKGFSEMKLSFWHPSHMKFFMYSDNPHMHRSNYLEKFGRYFEGRDGNITEYRMSISFMQKRGKGLFYDKYAELFDHKNSEDEPSTFNRASWRSSRSPLFLFVRWFYLRYKWLKCTKDLMYMKP